MLKLRIVAVVGLMVAAMSGSVATVSAGVAVPTDVVSISPSGVTVGVAHPITVTFAGDIADRAAAERRIEIASPTVPVGNFTWLNDRVLQWNPTEFWPAHSTISLSVGDIKTSFETGAATVGVASISNHTFTVSVDGEVLREMPASMGKYGFATPVGNFTALEKQATVIMDSRTIGIPLDDPEGYKLTVYDAVRVTWGGVYVHGAPWSVGSQGYENVSHGCINLSPDNADWYYNMVRIGDPIIIEA
ncbi:L,D-transpeptidase [Mycobacterium barrassiae]|uniref:L,D-transpeptidase n=1 Tax=Mycobacterium barrassiae TaxID=319709 RepID=UPI0027E2A653|nr:L,D-transpeptidase [Mycobacterium barrassiae]